MDSYSDEYDIDIPNGVVVNDEILEEVDQWLKNHHEDPYPKLQDIAECVDKRSQDIRIYVKVLNYELWNEGSSSPTRVVNSNAFS